MRALLLDSTEAAGGKPLTAAPLAASAGYDEAWLQGLLFDHPDLLPLDVIDPGAGPMVPVCRELPLPNGGTPAYLDILGVTPAGRLVLVECKLWRNPQARREVVGQLLDYAARLRSWTYADLSARVRARTAHKHANPLFELAKVAKPELDEARFVDAVAASLACGDLMLIVAGDGIRSDMHVIAEYLGAPGGLMARLALVELKIWQDGNGRKVVVPHLPFQTEVVTQRLLVGSDGQPVALAREDQGSEEDVGQADNRKSKIRTARNRTFWDRVIGSLSFSHPDQPPAGHGGDNWIRVPLPAPCQLTLYRHGQLQQIGAFVTFLGAEGQAAFSAMEGEQAAIEAEVGEPLRFKADAKAGTFSISASRRMPFEDPGTTNDQIEWLCRIGDRLATAMRTRL